MIKSKVQNCYMDCSGAECAFKFDSYAGPIALASNGPDVEREPMFFAVGGATVLNNKSEVVFKGDLVVANLDGYAIVPRGKHPGIEK